MGRNFSDVSFLITTSGGNPVGSVVPEALGIGMEGFQGMKRSYSELNIEAFFCMNSEGEGECPDGHDAGKKTGKFPDGDSTAAASPVKPSDRDLAGVGEGVIADDWVSADNISSRGRLTRLGWSLAPVPKGSSPASTGSALTYGCKDSEDLSDDDDIETEAGPSEQSMDNNELKRIRRKVSNRESARRSRRRKQAQLTELESQVDQLKGENSTLYKQLTEISHQCDNASQNNRALNADVEALRATVKLAQELVARGPLSNIVNHQLLQQSPLAPQLNSWNLCRTLDIPTVVDGDWFQGNSVLPGNTNFGTDSDNLSIKFKTDGTVPNQRTLSMEQLDAWVHGAPSISKQS